jgi:hypothetical protein
MLLSAAWSLSLPTFAQDKPEEESSGSPRFRLLVNGAYNATTRSFGDAATFTRYLEQGSSTRDYDGGTGFVFEVGGVYSILSNLGVMGSFEYFDASNDAAFREVVPHPLFFNQDRSIEGSVPSLSYKESVLHFDAVYTRDLSSFTVDLYGGPSWFFTRTEILTDITTSSDYPFDELSLDGTSSSPFEESPLGFNLGGALTFRVTRLFGIAFQARYSRARVRLQRDGADAFDFNAGGFRAGGGIRLSF